jgi:hypothetical protein
MLKQKGLTLSGFIMWAIIFAFAGLIAFKLGPAYLEEITIKKHLSGIAKDPAYASGNRSDIERAYGNKSMVEKTESVNYKDIIINKTGNGIALSVQYTTCVPLVYNIRACMDFNPSTE